MLYIIALDFHIKTYFVRISLAESKKSSLFLLLQPIVFWSYIRVSFLQGCRSKKADKITSTDLAANLLKPFIRSRKLISWWAEKIMGTQFLKRMNANADKRESWSEGINRNAEKSVDRFFEILILWLQEPLPLRAKFHPSRWKWKPKITQMRSKFKEKCLKCAFGKQLSRKISFKIRCLEY